MPPSDQEKMDHIIAIQLDPNLLESPEADLRYALPDLLNERSGGHIQDAGYVGDQPLMIVYLQARDSDRDLATVLDVIRNVCVLGNDLQSAVVGLMHDKKFNVVYPEGFRGELRASLEW